MPTLRRSKSLNDKITRQKNRTGDVIRDPRSPDAEGRTRQCVDNFQALVHLRKQTEDRARQLELAYNYATNGSGSFSRPPSRCGGTAGGVEIPFSPVPVVPPATPATAVTSAAASSSSSSHASVNRRSRLLDQSDSKIPGLYRRQRSSDRAGSSSTGPVVRRQESFQENQLLRQGRGGDQQQPGARNQRPMSMFEPRVAPGGSGGGGSGGAGSPQVGGGGGGSLFPSQDDLTRKDQVIQRLTESHHSLKLHNQQLLSKIDELEYQNHVLKDTLAANNIAPPPLAVADSPATPTSTAASPSQPNAHQHPSWQPRQLFPFHKQFGGRSQRSAASPVPGDVVRTPNGSSSLSAAVSPNSETSVSGYGSLAGSACGDPVASSPVFADAAVARQWSDEKSAAEDTMTSRGGDYEADDTLPLSEVRGGGGSGSGRGRGLTRGRTQSRDSTTQARSTSSSSDSCPPTLSRDSDRSDIDSIHEKLDQVLELEQQRGRDHERRIEELEKLLKELTSQRDTVLTRYKQIVDENDTLLKRDEQLSNSLQSLLDKQGQELNPEVRVQLQKVQEQLWDLSHEVYSQLTTALLALQASVVAKKSAEPATQEQVASVLDPQAKELLDKIADIVGPEYMKLGRHLNIPQPELETVEEMGKSVAEKTHLVLESWLSRTPEEENIGSNSSNSAVQQLQLAMQAIDKDIRLINHTPISGPERQSLRNCLQYAIDHVTDPHLVLDHLISMDELIPAGINFIQQVIEHRERALSRLWHVSEYRRTDIVSRLSLALDRSQYPHVSARLTDELAIQNSRLHSHSFATHQEPEEPATAANAVTASTPTTDTAAAVAVTEAPSVAAVPPPPSSNGSRPSALSQPKSKPVSRVPRPRSKTSERIALPAETSHAGRSAAAASGKPFSSLTHSGGGRQTPPATQTEKPRFVPQQQGKQTAISQLGRKQYSNLAKGKQTSPTASPATASQKETAAKERETAIPPPIVRQSSDSQIPLLQQHDRLPSASLQKEKAERDDLPPPPPPPPLSQPEGRGTPPLRQTGIPQTGPPPQRDKQAGPAPQREKQNIVWDRRARGSSVTSSKSTIVLEQGNRISRV